MTRSLADDLRGRSDEQLAALLRRRPDLARPAPSNLSALTARAGTRASVQRAVERLDLGLLHTLEAVVVAAADGPVTPGAVAELLGADATHQLDELWELGLLWRAAGGLRAARAVPDVLGSVVAGLGPRRAELTGRDSSHSGPLAAPDEATAVREEAPAAARAVLDRLVWGPPHALVPPSGAGREGVRWLREHGLVATTAPDQVTLAREVALALRGGRLHRNPELTAPPVVVRDLGVGLADQAAGAQARDALRLVDELAEAWESRPPRVLRSGGLASRDLGRLATDLDLPIEQAAWLVELARAAALVADDGELTPVWAPTPGYDTWAGYEAGHRWAALARAWSDSARAAHLVGARPRRTTQVNALGPDVHWPPVRTLRHEVLNELAGVPEGHAPAPNSVVNRLRWRRPLRAPDVAEQAIRGILREAEWLGLTGRGALGAAGRALASGADDLVVARIAADLLPPSVDHVLLQADLTAVVPGPVDGALSRFLRLVATVESRGGGSVLRFTADSVRRALDAGWTGDDVVGMLARSSRTPVPQPLEYLVRDVARRHGSTRVGATAAYVRSDDEAVLAAMLADRALAPALLRPIATTVLVSPLDPATLVGQLRDSGYAPVQEAFDGSVVHVETAQRRAIAREPAEAVHAPSGAVHPAQLQALVAALRAAPDPDAAPSQAPRLTGQDPAAIATALHEAAADGSTVWVGYADANGRTTRRLVRPLRVVGGRVYAAPGGTVGERESVLLLHRVTGVAPA